MTAFNMSLEESLKILEANGMNAQAPRIDATVSLDTFNQRVNALDPGWEIDRYMPNSFRYTKEGIGYFQAISWTHIVDGKLQTDIKFGGFLADENAKKDIKKIVANIFR